MINPSKCKVTKSQINNFKKRQYKNMGIKAPKSPL